jgi:hypothetical protein
MYEPYIAQERDENNEWNKKKHHHRHQRYNNRDSNDVGSTEGGSTHLHRKHGKQSHQHFHKHEHGPSQQAYDAYGNEGDGLENHDYRLHDNLIDHKHQSSPHYQHLNEAPSGEELSQDGDDQSVQRSYQEGGNNNNDSSNNRNKNDNNDHGYDKHQNELAHLFHNPNTNTFGKNDKNRDFGDMKGMMGGSEAAFPAGFSFNKKLMKQFKDHSKGMQDTDENVSGEDGPNNEKENNANKDAQTRS